MLNEHLYGMTVTPAAPLVTLAMGPDDELQPDLCRLAVERVWGSYSRYIVEEHLRRDQIRLNHQQMQRFRR